MYEFEFHGSKFKFSITMAPVKLRRRLAPLSVSIKLAA